MRTLNNKKNKVSPIFLENYTSSKIVVYITLVPGK